MGSAAALLLGDRRKMSHTLALLMVKTQEIAVAGQRKCVELTEEWEDIVAEARVEQQTRRRGSVT